MTVPSSDRRARWLDPQRGGWRPALVLLAFVGVFVLVGNLFALLLPAGDGAGPFAVLSAGSTWLVLGIMLLFGAEVGTLLGRWFRRRNGWTGPG